MERTNKQSQYFTNALIPVSGVWITEASYPKGFYAAKYDADGLTSNGRWFETIDKADSYARTICDDECLIAEARGTHLRCGKHCANAT